MKNFSIYIFLGFTLYLHSVNAQSLTVIKKDSNSTVTATRQKRLLDFKENNIKGSYPLSVAFYKTTHIVFDAPIKYFDTGSERIICAKVEGVENVLKVKATQMGAFETNITVITQSGNYYSFLVSYNEAPNKLNVTMCRGLDEIFDYRNGNTNEKIIFTDSYYTQDEMISFSKRIIDLGKIRHKSIHHIADKVGEVECKLHNIATRDGNMIFSIRLKNASAMEYSLEFVKFYVRDKSKRKKEVSQEIELKPNFLYVDGTDTTHEKKLGAAGTEFNLVFMIPKFSINSDKNLEIDLIEKDGSRHLNLKIDYATFYNQMNQL
jgi:conjugative transposon TraN protein